MGFSLTLSIFHYVFMLRIHTHLYKLLLFTFLYCLICTIYIYIVGPASCLEARLRMSRSATNTQLVSRTSVRCVGPSTRCAAKRTASLSFCNPSLPTVSATSKWIRTPTLPRPRAMRPCVDRNLCHVLVQRDDA